MSEKLQNSKNVHPDLRGVKVPKKVYLPKKISVEINKVWNWKEYNVVPLKRIDYKKWTFFRSENDFIIRVLRTFLDMNDSQRKSWLEQFDPDWECY